jgi:hypothetical protein
MPLQRIETSTGNNPIRFNGNIQPQANANVFIGNLTFRFATIYGVSHNALYADLAEMYTADQLYGPGTVVQFGGTEEITRAQAGTTRVAGVVSTNPAYLMNDSLTGSHITAVALIGRVPCKVVGPVQKGDMLVSAGDGFASACSSPTIGSVIGKALENFEGDSGTVEVVVGRL